MKKDIRRVSAVAILLFAVVAYSQDPQWVTINLGTDGRQSGHTGIGADGTLAWAEVNSGMIDIYRKRTDGTVELVTSHVGDQDEFVQLAPLRVQGDGTVMSFDRNPASNRWDFYADSVLAHTDSPSRDAVYAGDSLSYTATWSGNNYGHLSMFDSSTSTRTVDALNDRFVRVWPLAASDSGILFLQAEAVDPADTGFYLLENGILTPEPRAGQPENFTVDYGISSADFSGDYLAYDYGGTIAGLPETVYVVVVKNISTAEVSSFWDSYTFPWSYGPLVKVDSVGRAYFTLRAEFFKELLVFENGERRFVTTLSACESSDFNESGYLAYVRFPFDACAEEAEETDTTDIFILDLTDDSEIQVTYNEPRQYIRSLRINESNDIAFSYSEDVVYPDPAHPLLFAAASVIDTSPPSVPSGLAAVAVSQSRVDITWTASTDAVALDGYDVFRNDALIATVSVPNHQDSGLAAGVTYRYRVEAFDLANNRSQSSAVTVTTSPPVVIGKSGGGAVGIWFLMAFAGFYGMKKKRFDPFI